MNHNRLTWVIAACICIGTAALLPALRFSHAYTVDLRAVSPVLLGTSGMGLLCTGIFSYVRRHRALGLAVGCIGLFVATGSTVWLPGIVALVVSTILTSVALLRFVPLALTEKPSSLRKATPN
jgi:hypothetical protein